MSPSWQNGLDGEIAGGAGTGSMLGSLVVRPTLLPMVFDARLGTGGGHRAVVRCEGVGSEYHFLSDRAVAGSFGLKKDFL